MKLHVFLFFLLFTQIGISQEIILSEILASNATAYFDFQDKTPDWIEIKNVSNSTINLSNFSVASASTKLTPWKLPNVNLAPGNYYFFVATNPLNEVVQWETIIDKGDTWKYIVPLSEPASNWKNVGYDDNSWNSGNSGFGFADGDDQTVLNPCISVFLRKTFTITDKSTIVDALLHMDFDDGFVAYINGQEVARASMNGTPPSYNANASGYNEAFLYRGLPIPSFTIKNIQDIIQVGQNVLSIQVHNSDINSSDLTAIPILTLGYSQPKTPSNGVSQFTALKSTSLDANFKINASNETIYLFENTTIIDSITIENIPVDVSIGRIPNDNKTLYYFKTPTPGTANSLQKFFPETISKPIVSKYGRVFNTNFYMSLFAPTNGSILYYTTNGENPTELSNKYTDSIYVKATSNFKVIAIKPGYLPSEILVVSYIKFTRTQNLPIVSITVKNADFFDYNTGIYVLGPNASNEQPNFGANFWEDWERPSHIEIFNVDGSNPLSMNAGVKIAGNWSRANPQKSLKFYARSVYGDKSINYQLFKDKPIYEFQSFILRNSGNDYCNTHMRDGMISGLIRNLGVDRQAYAPAIVYINGQYYGIQNFREKINADYIVGNHGVSKENISLMDNNSISYGTADNFYNLYNFIEQNDLSIQANYDRVKEDLDIDNFIKYNVVELFTVNEDWPGNNVKRWRENNATGKWRYILYDLDFGFGIWDDNKVNNNMLEFALANDPSIGWPNSPNSTLMLRKLAENTEFSNLFMNYTADILNTTFFPDSIIHHIDSIANIVTKEFGYHAARWGAYADGMVQNVEKMKDFGTERGQIMRTHFEQHFNTAGSYTLHITTNLPNAGKVHLNSIDITNFAWKGEYFNNVPITLTALPAPGFEFVRWEGAVASTNTTIHITTAITTNVNAIFIKTVAPKPNIFVTEINYNSLQDSQSGDWIEIYNANTSAQNISGWILKDNKPFNSFIVPQGTTIPAQGFAILCSDTAKFNFVYKNENIQKLGNFNFKLSKSNETIRLYDSLGFIMREFSYSNALPWPKKCDGYGYSLECTNLSTAYKSPLVWRAATWQGTPGNYNNIIELTPDRNNIIINEINFNSHSNFSSGDWIELYNKGNFYVDISEWVMRDKSNSIFILPKNTVIPAKSYMVFAKNPQKFEIAFPTTSYIPMNIGLSSAGDAVMLFDQYEFLIDSLQYSMFSKIALGANGTGKTLSLISPELDNSKIANWGYGIFGGTPGLPNDYVNGIATVPSGNIELYPNPCSNFIIVTMPFPFSIEFFDIKGAKVKEIQNSYNNSISVSDLQAGIYSVRLTNSGQTKSYVLEKK